MDGWICPGDDLRVQLRVRSAQQGEVGGGRGVSVGRGGGSDAEGNDESGPAKTGVCVQLRLLTSLTR